MNSATDTSVDDDSIIAALKALPSGNRHQTEARLLRVLPGVRAAILNKTPWPLIIKELESRGIKTSPKRLKDLIKAEDTPSAGGPAPQPGGAGNDASATGLSPQADGPEAVQGADHPVADDPLDETVQGAEGGAA